MDIFDDNNRLPAALENRPNNYNSPRFPVLPRGLNLVDQPSRVERFISKASGSVSQVIKLLFLIIGLVTFWALLKPYLNFIHEFSEWLDWQIVKLF